MKLGYIIIIMYILFGLVWFGFGLVWFIILSCINVMHTCKRIQIK